MREFHEFIIVDNKPLLFYFTRTYTATREEFFVSVIRSFKVFSFDMQRDDWKWKITTPVPEWIETLEEELSKSIKNNMRSERV